ncbi:type II toxin-antitoxin system VapC family toxin [Desulfitibacter alkalitolerans]|uniref:type II toxin-antitoxin system VapC family toxin n=1 Tax=Desulfitibacter alkalitolerans TaxID=264641 RepID=UPI00068757B1|nr:type II toxin-antitoxin system VapC family toxin [Desulfitibacter alkalitolerans]
MSKYICIDTSVLIKLFFEEEDSFKARELMLKVIENDQIIVLPAFAWAEIGSIFRKKIRNKQISLQEAEEMWASFIEKHSYDDKSEIIDYAAKIGIAPFILIGRLQHDGLIDYKNYNSLIPSYDIKGS